MKNIVVSLEIKDGILFEYLQKNVGEGVTISNEVIKLATLGANILSMVSTEKEVDFVKAEFEKLQLKFQSLVDVLESKIGEAIHDSVGTHFDPSQQDSYLNLTANHLRESLTQLKSDVKLIIEGAEKTGKVLIENASKVSSDKLVSLQSNIDTIGEKLNPSLETSYLGITRKSIVDMQNQINSLMDFKNTGSFSYQLTSKLENLFGVDSPITESVRAIVKNSQSYIMEELGQLRDVISQKEGAKDLLSKTAQLKGQMFEDDLMFLLEGYAKPFGDSVEALGTKTEKTSASKKGDFIYTFSSGDRVVIEAKDTPVGLQPMRKYLDEAMTNRNCDFAILIAKSEELMAKQIGAFNFYDGNKLFTTVEFLQPAMEWSRLFIANIMQGDSIDGADKTVMLDALKQMNLLSKEFKTAKQKLTSMSTTVNSTVEAVSDILDVIKGKVEEHVSTIKEELEKEK